MFQLIFVVISIALMSAMTVVATQYIPLDAHARKNMLTEAVKGLDSLETSVIRYLCANRDSSGNIIYPGDNVDVMPALAPAHGFIPPDVNNELTWEVRAGQYGGGLPAVGICLRPISGSSENQAAVLQSILQSLPVGSAFRGSGCNATSDSAAGTHLTLWVVISQIN